MNESGMLYRVAADVVFVIHLCFIIFVVLGGFLTRRWPRVAYAHIACMLWGALIEFAGWICPLTPLENYLMTKAGETAYRGSFTEHYLIPLIYPNRLTRQDQVLLGIGVLIVNLLAYGWTFYLKERV